MEKLYEIWSEDRYDLLVLDTPPSRNALDFLEAPNRLLQFIEGRSLQVFLAPTGFAAKVAGRGTSVMFSILRTDHRRRPPPGPLRVLRLVLRHGRRLSRARDEGERAARRRAEHLPRRLRAAVRRRSRRPSFFRGKLAEQGLPFGGAIVNKVHRRRVRSRRSRTQSSPSSSAPTSADGSPRTTRTTASSPSATGETSSASTSELGAEDVIEVPYLDEDVHDLEGLAEINRHLFAPALAAPMERA